ncbi:cdf-like metal transporter [Moniliophthora roreri MCA 2997]|uniref:Cdf-like metal transporter n=1 Tax=Moniliophthora roreri (strain MCA 2997) TaxID=1381753 RepID=V2YWV5_MONRO|nr:cdf-like metal transporter [Moniliophthora roreri MCA 2997]
MVIDTKVPIDPSSTSPPSTELTVPAVPAVTLERTSNASNSTTATATVAITSNKHDDLERNPSPGAIIEADPYNFKGSLRNEEQLSELKSRTGKKVASYQSKQNTLIVSLLKPIETHTQEAQIEEEATRLPVKIAVWASLIANLSLCVLQMYAAISALSLSLLATGIDSIFDIGSNVVLFWLHRKSEKLDVNKWPVGGARLETIGNIVYGSLMASVNLVVVVESCRSIISHSDADETNDFHLPSIISVAAALFVKLVLFIYCFSLRKNSSQVHVLWEDHRNDLWINTFGILMSTGGSKLRWYLDPMGAIIIGLGIIVAWGRTIYGQFELLAGKSAPHEMLQLLIYKTATYSEEIQQVDTVRAYHSGPDYFVEIDIVMNANTPLWRAHDLSQKLQDQIEELPNVERCFVHVDYETTHSPEHRKSM